MWAAPRLFNGELYMSSDGGDQPGMYDDDGDANTCSPARIIFKCDQAAGLGKPRLVKTTVNLGKGLECGTLFEWASSTACPLAKVSGAEGACTVTDSTYGYLYDMNALKAGGPFFGTSDNHPAGAPDSDDKASQVQAKYNLLPICDDSKSGNTLVLGESGDKINLGSAGATLVQTEDRNIELQMLGDDCTEWAEAGDDDANDGNDGNGGRTGETGPRSTILRFICSDDVNPPNASIAIIEESRCAVVFGVATALACPPATEETSCIVDDPKTGQVYDLSRLSRRNPGDSNWRVVNNDPGCGFIEMNVCAPLIYKSPFKTDDLVGDDDDYSSYYRDDQETTGPKCPHATAICAYKERKEAAAGTQPGEYGPQVLGAISQGGADNAPTLTASGDLMIRYDAPGSCSSEVVFRCLPGRIGEPFFISLDKEACVYHFEWRTSAACPVEDQLGADCKIKDGATGFTYDLNPLRQQRGDNDLAVAFRARTSATSNTDGGELEDWIVALNVCDDVGTDRSDVVKCTTAPGMGAVMTNSKKGSCVAGGSASKQLELNDGALSLTYRSNQNECLGGVRINFRNPFPARGHG